MTRDWTVNLHVSSLQHYIFNYKQKDPLIVLLLPCRSTVLADSPPSGWISLAISLFASLSLAGFHSLFFVHDDTHGSLWNHYQKNGQDVDSTLGILFGALSTQTSRDSSMLWSLSSQLISLQLHQPGLSFHQLLLLLFSTIFLSANPPWFLTFCLNGTFSLGPHLPFKTLWKEKCHFSCHFLKLISFGPAGPVCCHALTFFLKCSFP